jgi:DNA polymerase I-like protein with 3'-5' exonuclease and polymerase domains
MAQVRKVEKWYWEKKYKVHTQWKRDWYANYKNDGGIMMKTGFAINGSYSKNDIINYPIQGSSFHQLLWSLPRINAAFRKFKMKSRVIGEVHDSVDVDAPPSERDDVIEVIKQIMTKDLVKAWPWLVVPPVIEAECCPVDRPFADLVGLKEELDGSWVPADLAKWKVKFGNWVLKS